MTDDRTEHWWLGFFGTRAGPKVTAAVNQRWQWLISYNAGCGFCGPGVAPAVTKTIKLGVYWPWRWELISDEILVDRWWRWWRISGGGGGGSAVTVDRRWLGWYLGDDVGGGSAMMALPDMRWRRQLIGDNGGCQIGRATMSIAAIVGRPGVGKGRMLWIGFS